MGFFSKLFGSGVFSGGSSISSGTTELVKGEWEQIDLLISQKGPSQLRQALIKADKTLDAVLKDLVSGNTLGERLKQARNKFEYSDYDKIWKAHIMRNSLVHEAGYDPPYHMVIDSIEILRSGIQKLGVNV